MSSKRLKADILAAAQKVASGSVAGVKSVSRASGNDFTFTYHHQDLPKDVEIQVVAQNSDDYAEGNSFMVFTEDGDADQLVTDTIQNTQDYLIGMRVYELITELAKQLDKAFKTAKAGNGSNNDDDEADLINSDFDGDDDDFDDYDEEDDWDDEHFGLSSEGQKRSAQSGSVEELRPVFQRIKHDLREVKKAGYRVGLLDALGKTSDRGIVSISIRVKKLALSEEALEAWDIDEDDYLVLLIRFEEGYKAWDRIISGSASHARVSFRLGKCKKYKPSLVHALGAFAETNRVRGNQTPPKEVYHHEEEDEVGDDGTEFRKVFISASLDQFMNESFVSLLKIRDSTACSWDTANEHLIEKTGLGLDGGGGMRSIPEYHEEPMIIDEEIEDHRMLACDHLTDSNLADQRSFPLVAMQFAVRYFVKCTEYCLRCHRRLEKEFEALRPYVCSEPLCLFQYMAMGFGPSVEHEITTQPYVVDLLVSLCYSALQPTGSYHGVSLQTAPTSSNPERTTLPIRTLPVGLRLQIPDMSASFLATPRPDTEDPPRALRAHWSGDQLLFDIDPNQYLGPHITENKWIAFRTPGTSLVHHAVISKVDLSRRSVISVAMKAQSGQSWGVGVYTPYNALSANNSAIKSQKLLVPTEDPIVEVYPYDTDFDGLDNQHKGEALRHILDTLPPIFDIDDFLNKHPHASIRSMDRVSPAAASLLQWIVSSNRSCIYQIDHTREVVGFDGKLKFVPVGKGKDRSRERIPGMQAWAQFRFAQGSPDKELRFKRALQEVAAQQNIKENPTIFAWHGSSVCNWHSIVRTGLDFNETRNGRAYGHGVYFSQNFSTSQGYSTAGAQHWPNSELKINLCMSLNEIINSPESFVSKSPHYVVNQLDWHQCRYLFVKTDRVFEPPNKAEAGAIGSVATDSGNGLYHKQPPSYTIFGPDNKPLRIPLSAIPFRHVGAEKSKQGLPSKRDLERLDGESSEDEDSRFLDSDGDGRSPPSKRLSAEPSGPRGSSKLSSFVKRITRSKTKAGATSPPSSSSYLILEKGLTDFEPGTLDLSTLPRLREPEFANPAATKHLASELKKLQQTQSTKPLNELGWYIDFDKVENLYQWIVELHTFDPSLPLANDMLKAGVTSVVLEIRFPKDYPYSPPFIRVVRPRFLPFLQGGGGHVTAGGAMCMELLTGSGWSPVNSMESVLLQVKVAMCSLEPRPARLQSGYAGDYGVGEAVEAYMRAVKQHGWKIPEDLHATAGGGQGGGYF